MAFIDSISDRFSRSWEISKATFHVMRQDKEIMLFPVLSSLFSLILLLLFAFPVFLGGMFTSESGDLGIFLYMGVFLLYFIITFVAVFFNAGIVHIAKTRFAGGDATFADGLNAGFHHLGVIFKWALFSATIGLILNILQAQADRQRGIAGFISSLVIRFIGLAWAIVSVFVVPAMVLKNLGPIDALKSSALAIRKTWGESLIRYYGLGFVQGGFIVVGLLVLGIPGVLMFFAGSWTGVWILLGLFILWMVIVSLVFSSANTIFNTALFMYADSGKVPKAFAADVVKQAFRKK